MERERETIRKDIEMDEVDDSHNIKWKEKARGRRAKDKESPLRFSIVIRTFPSTVFLRRSNLHLSLCIYFLLFQAFDSRQALALIWNEHKTWVKTLAAMRRPFRPPTRRRFFDLPKDLLWSAAVEHSSVVVWRW